MLKKTGFVVIGIIVAIAIVGLVFGLNSTTDSAEVPLEPTQPESETSETEPEEGISHQISLSDKATAVGNP